LNSAVIVAGGTGSRFDSNIPKQFIKIDNQEILAYSVNTFLNHPNIDEVLIVCHKDWIDHVITHYPKCKVVERGERRQDSSKIGVNGCNPLSKNILIHDAARPFVSTEIISNCIEKLEEFEVVAPILDSQNSLISIKDKVVSCVDRNEIKQVQTPQCFKAKLIKDIFDSNVVGTDEIGLALQYNPKLNIGLIKGEIRNYKITTSVDLQKTEMDVTSWT